MEQSQLLKKTLTWSSSATMSAMSSSSGLKSPLTITGLYRQLRVLSTRSISNFSVMSSSKRMASSTQIPCLVQTATRPWLMVSESLVGVSEVLKQKQLCWVKLLISQFQKSSGFAWQVSYQKLQPLLIWPWKWLSSFVRKMLSASSSSSLALVWPAFPWRIGLPLPTWHLNTGRPVAISLLMRKPSTICGWPIGMKTTLPWQRPMPRKIISSMIQTVKPIIQRLWSWTSQLLPHPFLDQNGLRIWLIWRLLNKPSRSHWSVRLVFKVLVCQKKKSIKLPSSTLQITKRKSKQVM